MDKELLELYSDYLLSSFSYTTATGLSIMTEGEISHDKITRFLSESDLSSKQLWKLVKPTIREIETEDGIVAIDDTIEEKPYTEENEIVSWYHDHTKGRAVKGINLLSALYVNEKGKIPINYLIVKKTKTIYDEKKGKQRRVSEVTKNQMYQQMLNQIIKNKVQFKYVINDVWYASAANMVYIKKKLEKEFIMPIKTNRKVALSRKDKIYGKYVTVSSLELKENTIYKIYLEDVPFELYLVKQIFKNEDGTEGILYLVTSQKTLTYNQITELYQKRWKIEVYHKSLKKNASLCKSPARMIRTQSNHIFASIFAFYKLECMSMKTRLNHFAIKARIYEKAIKVAYEELQQVHQLSFEFAK
jgi:DDE superfamily endonuclease